MLEELRKLRHDAAGIVARLDALISLAQQQGTQPGVLVPVAPASPPTELPSPAGGPIVSLAWGRKVSAEFRARVLWIARELRIPGDWLMAVMAFESGETFSPSKRNMAGSGAVGLIQFMPRTAKALGTSSAELAAMSAEDQLNYVFLYFERYAGRITSLADLYMLVLWPAAFGKPPHYEFDWTGITYAQNKGLDLNKNGKITKTEAAHHVEQKLAKGLQEGNVWRGPMPDLGAPLNS